MVSMLQTDDLKAAHRATRSELPFRRFDVVDSAFNVVLSGPTAQSLLPTVGATLEPDLAREVRSIVRECRMNRRTLGVGLIGLDHGVRVLARPEVGSDYYLVCVERTAFRGPFERIVARFALDSEETELARLAIIGCDFQAVALRLGMTPKAAEVRTTSLLRKMGLPSRAALVALTLPRETIGRSKRNAASTEHRKLLKPAR